MEDAVSVGIDGARALRKAVVHVFDHLVIQRCQMQEIRNVAGRLPRPLRGPVGKKMRAAYHADSALEAEAALTALARELDKTHPGVAAGLCESLAETLTVLRLGVLPTLAVPHAPVKEGRRWSTAVKLDRPLHRPMKLLTCGNG